MGESANIAIATVHSMLIVVNIVGNCLVCAIIKNHRDMRIPINYLLVNLAVADILYAAFIAPDVFFRLYSTHPEGTTGTVLCKLVTSGSLAWIGAASSVVTLVAIAIERYYAVVYPFGTKWELTERKLKAIILGSWIFSVLFCLPLFLVSDVKRKMCAVPEGWLIKWYHWMWFVLILVSLAAMAGFQSRAVYKLWFKRNDDSKLTFRQSGVVRVRKRVTLMVVVVTALFGVCWLTDMTFHLVDSFLSYSIDKDVYHVTHTTILFSSAVNPFVYALINRNFRQKLKKMICCSRCTAVVHPATRGFHSMELTTVTQPDNTVKTCFVD